MLYKYEKRLVAFIDILGFAGKINSSKKDVNFLNQLCECIFSIKEFIKEAQEDFDLPSTSNVEDFKFASQNGF